MKKYLFLLFFTIIGAYSFAGMYPSDDWTINDFYQFALDDNKSDLSDLLTKKPDSFRPDFYDGVTDEKINLIVKKIYEDPKRCDTVIHSIMIQNPFTLMVIEKKYFNINTIYEHGYTLLSKYFGTLYTYEVPEIYTYLLENGADPSIKDEDGKNVIESMASQVYVDWKKVEVLLKYVDDMKDYNPQILFRSFESYNSIWKVCAEKNIDVNKADSKGNTVLYKASERGNLEAVKCFIEKGASVDCVNEDLMTPLMVACKKNHLDVVSYLVSKKANVNKYDEDGWTPLKYSLGKLDIMKVLLEAGAKPNAKNKKDKTPIGNRCVEYGWTHYLETIKLLGEYKTNFKAVDERDENTLGTFARSLWKFSNKEILEVVDYLVSKGCDINSTDYLGRTIMNYCEDPELAQELIKRGADEVSEIYSSEAEYLDDLDFFL